MFATYKATCSSVRMFGTTSGRVSKFLIVRTSFRFGANQRRCYDHSVQALLVLKILQPNCPSWAQLLESQRCVSVRLLWQSLHLNSVKNGPMLAHRFRFCLNVGFNQKVSETLGLGRNLCCAKRVSEEA